MISKQCVACAEGAEKFFPRHQKKFPKPRFSAALELRGEGGRGSRGEGSPPVGMKIKASPCPPPPPSRAIFRSPNSVLEP